MIYLTMKITLNKKKFVIIKNKMKILVKIRCKNNQMKYKKQINDVLRSII